jgi:hypothetical protein
MRTFRIAGVALCVLAAVELDAQVPQPSAAQPVQDCGSVVIIKCDKPQSRASDARRDAARQMQSRRADRATFELDRVIIESEAERLESPEQTIGRALYRPLVTRVEHSFSIGESAQCTCMNICPPPPFPCCNCTDRVGSSLATAPGWKPTR